MNLMLFYVIVPWNSSVTIMVKSTVGYVLLIKIDLNCLFMTIEGKV